MLFAFARDQTYLFAAVAIGDLTREDLLDYAPLPVMQDHRCRDDPTGPNRPYRSAMNEIGQEIHRVSMAKYQTRRPPTQSRCKSGNRFVRHLQRVKIIGAIEQRIAKPPTPAKFQV